jgi:hypothetical protein
MCKEILASLLDQTPLPHGTTMDEACLIILEDLIKHGNNLDSWLCHHGLQNKIDEVRLICRGALSITHDTFWEDDLRRDRAAFIGAAMADWQQYAGVTFNDLTPAQKENILVHHANSVGSSLHLPYMSWVEIDGGQQEIPARNVGMNYIVACKIKVTSLLPVIFGQRVPINYKNSEHFKDFNFDEAFANLTGFQAYYYARDDRKEVKTYITPKTPVERVLSGEISQSFVAKVWIPGCDKLRWRRLPILSDEAGILLCYVDKPQGRLETPFMPSSTFIPYSYLLQKLSPR